MRPTAKKRPRRRAIAAGTGCTEAPRRYGDLAWALPTAERPQAGGRRSVAGGRPDDRYGGSRRPSRVSHPHDRGAARRWRAVVPFADRPGRRAVSRARCAGPGAPPGVAEQAALRAHRGLAAPLSASVRLGLARRARARTKPAHRGELRRRSRRRTPARVGRHVGPAALPRQPRAGGDRVPPSRQRHLGARRPDRELRTGPLAADDAPAGALGRIARSGRQGTAGHAPDLPRPQTCRARLPGPHAGVAAAPGDPRARPLLPRRGRGRTAPGVPLAGLSCRRNDPFAGPPLANRSTARILSRSLSAWSPS